MESGYLLRAHSIAEILAAVWQCYKVNFVLLMTIGVMVILPIRVITIILEPDILNTPSIEERLAQQRNATDLSSLSGGLLSTIAQAAQTILIYSPITLIAAAFVIGQRLSNEDIWALVRPRLASYALAYVLLVVLFVMVIIVVAFVAILCPLVLIFLVPIFYFLITVVSFLPSVVMLEHDLTARQAITRAYILARKRFWRIVLMSIILSVLGTFFGLAIGAIFGLVLPMFTQNLLAITLLSLAVEILITPFQPIIMTLLYFDVRIREEQLDVELAKPEAAARSNSLPTGSIAEPLFQGSDVVNNVIIIVIIVALIFVFRSSLEEMVAMYNSTR